MKDRTPEYLLGFACGRYDHRNGDDFDRDGGLPDRRYTEGYEAGWKAAGGGGDSSVSQAA